LLKHHKRSNEEWITERILTSKVITFKNNINSSELFSHLSDLPWSIWLDSCDNDHVDSQFDIMVWDPIVTLCTQLPISDQVKDKHSLTTTINHIHKSVIHSKEDPLDLLNKAIKSTFSNIIISPEISFPFKGGAVGCFSYDLGREFEVLPELCEEDINLPNMSVGIYNKTIIFDNKNNTFHLLCLEHERSDIEAFLFTSLETKSIVDTTKSPEPDTSFILHSDWVSNMSEDEYAQKFNKVHNYILEGDCYQINLAQRFTSKYSGDEFEAYKTLRKENNAPFSAFIRLNNSAILSVSPERFLQLNDQHIQSKPIKGTLPRHTSPIKDKEAAERLKLSTKDRAENLMIVDLLRNDISKVCESGSVAVPKLFNIESFPAVHHLVSTVEGKLSSEFNATDLLRGAFPGGSITGAPKIRAMEIIEELEPHRRSTYCGSIGYISACGNMDTSITIRTLICENNNIHCWAGGGLVADSVLANEYQETFDKVKKIIPTLKNKYFKL
jgi:para-aminobenzoate synthetase component 1